jgi:hypothetical protein
MHRAVKALPVLGGWIHEAIASLIAQPDLAKKEQQIEEVCAALILEFRRQQLSEHHSTFLPDHGPVIHETIVDSRLRQRNVWVG